MGVHGLSRHIESLGLDANATPIELKEGSTLCVDGDGLIFHLFRLAYREHYNNIVATDSTEHRSKLLQCQLLLPLFTPLSLIHDITTSYLLDLILKHGLHLHIYFDGSDQFMKRRQKTRRQQTRNVEWENTRQLCIHGILPERESAQSRSAALRQARGAHHNVDDAEFFLSSFPFGPLAFLQIKQSIREFAHINTVLFRGSIHLINCNGEADAAVARASALNESAYALANDTDYLIYGTKDDGKEVKYIQFNQIKPADERLCGTFLTRSEISHSIGLFCAEAMIELSIILGNDYTAPLLLHDNPKKQRKYWESLRWHRDEEYDTFPSRLNNQIIPHFVDHVGERVSDGWELTSTIEELKLAIEFSYVVYSFGNTESFRSRANALVDDDDEEEYEGKKDKDSAMMMPSLPQGFDDYVARASLRMDMDVYEAAVSPLVLYLSEVGDRNNEYYVEQKHLDALKMTLETLRLPSNNMEPPRHQFHFNDIHAIFILEKLLSRVISGSGDANVMPSKNFDHMLFLSFLESISFEDFALNDVATNREEMYDAHTVAKDESSMKVVLPIDDHREDILNAIKTQRVTIIQGGTGSGKSSRVPCFLLRADPPQPSLAAPEVKMIVSQPRRIAAKALAERVRKVEPDLSHKVALRMGHGMKEFETNNTRCWFVTTGYAVRLLANHPHFFDSHTHLIIDEVHERSVDSDILCLLCRRLLHIHPTIRLVLMSATLAAELYSQYFGSPPPIHVGVRRFPINEYFVEDLDMQLLLSRKHSQYAQDIYDECKKNRCSCAPPDAIKKKMYHLASQITASVGKHGSSVLIFVPGMSDIESISELIERLNVRGVRFTCFPIHSDIPFEEQMEAFEPSKEGEVKVVIATNAAESSVTLPDVDHVVCLGLFKQIAYNKSSHRQQLTLTWISKASATQRAGRTGRVRNGNVYRLYSRDAYNDYFDPFEAGEILRTPLDSVILNLRDMLNEPVTEILLNVLEAPDISTIERSFRSLYSSNFISLPSDDGEITSLGRLAVALGIDLKLGAFVGLGIQFGVAAESIELAAILSFNGSPWAVSHPMYHDTSTFNAIASTTFTSRCYYDAGLYSEPMATSNILFDYYNCKNKDYFCRLNRLSRSKMHHLSTTVKSLRGRVAERLDVRSEALEMDSPFCSMHPTKITLLRIIQVWLFHDTMLVKVPSISFNKDRSISIPLQGKTIQHSDLEQILDPKTHIFHIENCGKIVQQGSFDASDFKSSVDNYMATFRIRFISYILEKEVDLSLYCVGTSLQIYVLTDIWGRCQLLRDTIIGMMGAKIETVVFQGNTGAGNQRGVRGRACGAWYPESGKHDSNVSTKSITILARTVTKQDLSLFKKTADIISSNKNFSIRSVICNEIKETKTKVSFIITSFGECHEVSKIDLCDIFADPHVQSTASTERLNQTVTFEHMSDNSTDEVDGDKSCPLIEDGPEGARLLSVLASERRRDNFIRLCNGGNGEQEIDINIPRSFSINGKKGWKRKDGNGVVYAPVNSVCSAVLPIDGSKELFACCSNTLDLRGGACRVDGITLCPPGRLFCGLALLSFGINPSTSSPVSFHDSNNDFLSEESKEERKDGGLDNIIQEALDWIRFRNNLEQSDEWRVKEALRFHMSCIDLGETLACQSDRIRSLCAIFDGVNGNQTTTWEGFDMSLTEASASQTPNGGKSLASKGGKKHNTQSTIKMGDQCDSNTTFICPGCYDIFNCVDVWNEHKLSCCFGLVRGLEPIRLSEDKTNIRKQLFRHDCSA